jgi:hypothetical protein
MYGKSHKSLKNTEQGKTKQSNKSSKQYFFLAEKKVDSPTCLSFAVFWSWGKTVFSPSEIHTSCTKEDRFQAEPCPDSLLGLIPVSFYPYADLLIWEYRRHHQPAPGK